MAFDWPSSSRPGGVGVCSVAVSFRRSALATSSRRVCRSTGLLRKSKAPALSASMAEPMLPCAVIIATGMRGYFSCMWRMRSMPLPSGRRISVRQRSKWSAPSSDLASCTVSAPSLSSFMRDSVSASSSRISGSSSTISTLGVVFASAFMVCHCPPYLPGTTGENGSLDALSAHNVAGPGCTRPSPAPGRARARCRWIRW